MQRKGIQEMSNPPVIPNHDGFVITMVLDAIKFMTITDTTNKAVTVPGILLNNIFQSLKSNNHLNVSAIELPIFLQTFFIKKFLLSFIYF